MAGFDDIGDQTRLSLRLYEVLENVGASENMRKLHKRTQTTIELVDTVYSTLLCCRLTPCYVCGSSYEGSVTPDLSSDTDNIICFPYPPVVLEPRAAPPGGSLLMVRDEWTYPGYAKLQLMRNGVPLIGNHLIVNETFGIDEVNRLCRRHFFGDNMDGPADKFVDENGVHINDNVQAFKCNTLPVFASNRLDQLRRRGFLSKEELDKLNSMGCMFVSAGYFLSPEKEVEWRLSLSLQERHFMTKLNPTQHKVYIVLKLIKRNIVEKVLGSKILTSYHCKTCVLYAVEMTQGRSWIPDNLIKCLMQCIKLLTLWLKLGFCPNYFNIDQNLFSKEGFSESKKQLLQILELIPGTNNFLELLQTDHIRDVLIEGEGRWKNEITRSRNKQILKLNYRLLKSVFVSPPEVLNKLCGGHYTVLTLVAALESIQGTEIITEHTAAETRIALDYWRPWIHLHIAKSVASVSYMCHARYKRKMMKLAEFHFRKAGMTDLVNVKLSTVSVLFKSEKFEACFRLLQEVEREYTIQVTRICPCTKLISCVYYDQQEEEDRQQHMSRLSIRKVMKRFYACCVTFLPCQFQIVPSPLQYEMFRSFGTHPGSRNEIDHFWFDMVVIDAKVYVYFMLYLVSTKLQREAHKRVAMDNIRAVIEEDNIIVLRNYRFCQLGHRETAYNLLGWIYTQEQRYGDALQCFLKSWEIRPFHNAAKFHMRDLLTTLSERIRHGSA